MDILAGRDGTGSPDPGSLDDGLPGELADARRTAGDLRWLADATDDLVGLLDEVAILRRLGELVVSRLADIAVVDLFTEDQVRRVAIVTADGRGAEALDGDGVLARADVSDSLPLDTVTYTTLAAAPLRRFDGHELDDPQIFSASTRRLLGAIGAVEAVSVRLDGRDRPVGVLGLARGTGRPAFDEIELLLAADLGRRVGLMIDNARLYRGQREISLQLQHALMPAVMPGSLPLTAACRYLPARDRFEVGGDWYDVFRRRPGSDRIVMAIGDVAGHDLRAATTMAAVRNLLRGIVVASDGAPSEPLSVIDRGFADLGVSGTASALLMFADPGEDGDWQLEWSNAGHLPPLLLRPDGSAELLDHLHGPILGTHLRTPRGSSTAQVPAGSTLVLYTDGLIEIRAEAIHVGLDRLLETARTLRADRRDLEAVVDELIERQRAGHEDDTAVLAVHLPATA